MQYDEEVFGKGAKKHIPDDDILANHIVSKAKAIYELKDVVTKELKDKISMNYMKTLSFLLHESWVKWNLQVLK